MIAYSYKNNVYLNITNRCTMNCTYCIRTKWNWGYRGNNLRLKKEPTVKEIIKESETLRKKIAFSPLTSDIVFCGYGEPLIRLETVKKVAAYYKKIGLNVRINTNGQANLYHGKNICPELKGLIDKICISLNAENAVKYKNVNRPRYGLKSFNAVLTFAKECKKYIKDVSITSVKLEGTDINKCRQIAKKIGVKFVERPFL
ncbi:MAG: TatD family nuclease-associated radical SAM protein [Elusimicrobia bacterium]|nr:TatD family nuclease-associated radical SAM protein [Elusimicrobiota bacterium]MBU2614352.1 TatD family nuclease-associated radical SAM protein [Elusimicrobiota bacterium]